MRQKVETKGIGIKSLVHLIFVPLTCWLLGAGFAPAQNGPAAGGLTVEVTPSVQLVDIVCRLAEYEEYRQGAIPAYNQAVDAWFAPFRTHAVVDTFRKIREEASIGYDAPMWLAIILQIAGDGGVSPRVALSTLPTLLDPRWQKVDVPAVVAQLDQFSRESSFVEFLAGQAGYCRQAVARMEGLVQPVQIVPIFDAFFGYALQGRYIISLGLLHGRNNYGPSVKIDEKLEEVYSITGVWQLDEAGVPVFSSGLQGLLMHEFCHSYTNRLVDAVLPELEGVGQAMFSKVEQKMASQGYGNWKTMFYESLVRACSIRMMAAARGEVTVAAAVAGEEKKGFLWMGELVALLKTYEGDRTQFKAFTAFMPRIVAFFQEYGRNNAARLSKSLREYKRKQKDYLATIRRKGPKLVGMSVKNGSRQVDPSLAEIVFVFSRPMKGVMALMNTGANFPGGEKQSYWKEDHRTFVMPIKLEPGTQYGFSLNHEDYLIFCSEDGLPLYPVEIKFTTRRE